MKGKEGEEDEEARKAKRRVPEYLPNHCRETRSGTTRIRGLNIALGLGLGLGLAALLLSTRICSTEKIGALSHSIRTNTWLGASGASPATQVGRYLLGYHTRYESCTALDELPNLGTY